METKESLVIDLIPEQRVLFNGHICHVQGRDKGSMIVSKVKTALTSLVFQSTRRVTKT